MSPLTLVLLLSGAFFLVFMAISVMVFWRGGGAIPRSAGTAASIFKRGTVAVVELNGVIMDSKKTLKKLKRVEEDPEVKAVVMRINSPGGSVAPSQEIYEAVKKLKKPVVASMGAVAASGGFYVACGAQKVFANPGTITGSIGVIMEFVNLEKLYEWAKIKRYSIKTGKFKDAGAEYHEMTPEARALLQGMVDDVLLQFKQAVVDGRKLPMEKVDAIADGRILSGAQAKAANLVDELGTIQDAIAEAAKLGGIQGEPRVVYPQPPKRTFFDVLMDDSRGEESSTEAEVGLAGASLLERLMFALVGGLRESTEGVGGRPTPSFNPGIYWLWNGTH